MKHGAVDLFDLGCYIITLIVFSWGILTAMATQKAEGKGREGELQRYENEEVICFSRRYTDSNIFCKFK
jgi:hypothetical protein